jgi:hypothetical protein
VVNKVAAYFAGDLANPLMESLAYEKWGEPLAKLLKAAVQPTMGDRAAGQTAKLLYPLSPLLLRLFVIAVHLQLT